MKTAMINRFSSKCLLSLVNRLTQQVENEKNDASAFDELGRLGEEMDFINSVPEKPGRGTKGEKRTSTEQRKQYATRGKKHSYCEAEVPDDDHYICKLNEGFHDFIFVLLTLFHNFTQFRHKKKKNNFLEEEK